MRGGGMRALWRPNMRAARGRRQGFHSSVDLTPGAMLSDFCRSPLFVIASLLAPVMLSAQAATAPLGFSDPQRVARLSSTFGDVDRAFREHAEREHIPGAVWAIVIDGRVAHIGATGFRDVASKSPVDSGTVFRIASMTKSFTAMSILKLRDEGKLSLDDPAERYVPEMASLKYPTSDAPKITIRHLLSHAAGFPEDNPWGDRQLADTDEQLSAM